MQHTTTYHSFRYLPHPPVLSDFFGTSSDSQLTPWRGPSKGQSRTERLFEKALNKILHSYAPFFISPLAREISRDKNVDVDWSSNNDADLSVCSIIEKCPSSRIVFSDNEDSLVFRVLTAQNNGILFRRIVYSHKCTRINSVNFLIHRTTSSRSIIWSFEIKFLHITVIAFKHQLSNIIFVCF